MSEERKRILQMLADGKIDVDQAERLLSAIGESDVDAVPDSSSDSGPKRTGKAIKYLYVVVNETPGGDHPGEQVKIKVPLKLLRAGVKLGSVLPDGTKDILSDKLRQKGLDIDLGKMDDKAFADIVDALSELDVRINEKDEQVRIYCE